jgi:hypothetical protein
LLGRHEWEITRSNLLLGIAELESYYGTSITGRPMLDEFRRWSNRELAEYAETLRCDLQTRGEQLMTEARPVPSLLGVVPARHPYREPVPTPAVSCHICKAERGQRCDAGLHS